MCLIVIMIYAKLHQNGQVLLWSSDVKSLDHQSSRLEDKVRPRLSYIFIVAATEAFWDTLMGLCSRA